MNTLQLNNLVDVSEDRIEIQFQETTGQAPFTVQCNGSPQASAAWLQENRQKIYSLLQEQGAVLLRGFPIDSAEAFEKTFRQFFPDILTYKNRTSPRDEVISKIYTSTSHPPDQHINMHTENSYAGSFNNFLGFFCLLPSETGGETPIADERKIIASIDAKARTKFENLGVRYVRNTIPGIGLGWRTIYQTEDRQEVEKFLIENNVQFEWISDDHLRTRWTLPAFRPHHTTGEKVWFNHMYFGHQSLFDPTVIEFLGEDNLPFTTFYGDGSVIEDDTIQQFNDAYEKYKIVFRWQKGDLLLLDNMMYSHGRNPFTGKRTILVAMA
ncbi:Taurine dioxygenase, alpha-ketoglutarate-dependent [Chryseolinea serpens]|uniref:Taurine dioxygenase, alpha-ketoglutarate-dependent n=1 Tax=Chryseolinea serpens TaxID=947013 RepID=A0A1M5V9Q2_9BACT|nr:TauD/TfdA family dioxygenase [Chryseolinea serpens]SHH71956.1 Taurine dioxygenase, alpha-ketoglutarate-dependent [Chryseolinea serpens]